MTNVWTTAVTVVRHVTPQSSGNLKVHPQAFDTILQYFLACWGRVYLSDHWYAHLITPKDA
jgi:hypothetical protein